MRPPAPYFGGKSRLAGWLVSLMWPHSCYLEPFAGIAAVLLAKPRTRFEVLNDIDGDLVTFFRVLRDRPQELVRVCRLTPYARDEFTACRTSPAAGTVDEVERARRWWVRVVQGFNHAPGKTSNGWSLSATRVPAEAVAAAGLVDRFTAVAHRLSGVHIENRDALELIAAHDRPDAVIDCDPPYLGSVRTGRTRRHTSADYTHDMTAEADHRALAVVLHECRGQVLLSGYPSALYDELYDGWPRASVRVRRPSANRPGHGGAAATETVWSNRPLPAQQSLDPLWAVQAGDRRAVAP